MSHFPMLIQYKNSTTPIVVEKFTEIEKNRPFKVIKTSYKD